MTIPHTQEMAACRTGLPLLDAMLPVLTPEDEISLEHFEHILGSGKLAVDPGVKVVLHMKLERPGRRRVYVNGVWIRGNSCDLELIGVSRRGTVTLVYEARGWGTPNCSPRDSRTYPWGADAEVRE